jgi:hypothetical protein
MCGPGSSVGIATGYGLDGPGIKSRWGEIFRTFPDLPWGPPSLLYNGYWVFPGVKSGRGVTLTPHTLLVPWSWKSRAITLLPLWAVRPVQSLSACTRVQFTFSKMYFLHKSILEYQSRKFGGHELQQEGLLNVSFTNLVADFGETAREVSCFNKKLQHSNPSTCETVLIGKCIRTFLRQQASPKTSVSI